MRRLLPLALVACADLPVPATVIEPPGFEEEEGEEGEGREPTAEGLLELQEAMHRAPPGVDWRAVERQNGVDEVARRATLAFRPRPLSDAGAVWVERGSDDQAGSMFAVVPSPSESGRIYAGAALGGLWTADVDALDWAPLGDDLYGGVHDLAVLPGAGPDDPDVLVATGDAGMVHRSTDLGRTWTVPEGLAPLPSQVRQLTQDASGRLWLVAGWSSDGWTWAWRVLRSTDAGASFEVVRELDGTPGDAWVPPGGDEVYVVGAELWHSDDGGERWTSRSRPGDDEHAAELAGHPGGRLWLATHDGDDTIHLFRSEGPDDAFVELGELEDDWGPITASSVDPDLLAYGGTEVHRSTDGGATFHVVNDWEAYYDDPDGKLHADLMAMSVVSAGDGETWWLGTHGGVYRSDDGLLTVRNLSRRGLRVSQYYDVLTSVADPAHVIAGAQDQGWQHGLDVAWDGEDVFEIPQQISGDWGQLTSVDGTHDAVIGVYPGQLQVSLGEDAPVYVNLAFPDDEQRSPWMPPVLADPKKERSFFWGGSQLWRYGWNGANWDVVAWSRSGLELDDDAWISALAASPLERDRLWLATSDGEVWRSDDRGRSWGLMLSGGPDGSWLYGAALLPSSRDADTVWVGGSGYGGDAVYVTHDGGDTWDGVGDGLPDTMVYCLCEVPDGSGRLVAGTETSVFVADPDGPWTDLSDGVAPITTYWACESLTHEATVRFATYGRGLWDRRFAPQGEGCTGDVDADGDGTPCSFDCDDGDAARHPGAEETCDGVDADCDGEAEPDDDGDGFLACADDCDDGDAAVHPGADDPPGDHLDANCDDFDAKTCGCASPARSAGASSWLAGLVGLVALRRRYRSARAAAT